MYKNTQQPNSYTGTDCFISPGIRPGFWLEDRNKFIYVQPLCTWDVKHIGHSDPADLIGGKTPDRAFWNAQIHATSANTDHL